MRLIADTLEAFEFDLEATGFVRVRNGSYGDEGDEHTYRVTVENNVPVSCTCKADEYRSGACKHRVAIAIRESVLATTVETIVDESVTGLHILDMNLALEPGDDDPY